MLAHHIRMARFPRLRTAASAVVLTAVLVASGLTFAGPARADATLCGFGSSSGNAFTCVQVFGQNRYVSYAEASVSVHDVGRTLKVCLRGPNGPIGCTGPTFVSVDEEIWFPWRPNRNVTAGSYCANTWRRNNNGSYTRIGHVCVRVG